MMNRFVSYLFMFICATIKNIQGETVRYYYDYECNEPLIASSKLSATSSLRDRGPDNAKLYGLNAWTASENDFDQQLVIDFGTVKNITRISTQGRAHSQEFVQEYHISYGSNGLDYVQYKAAGGEVKMFEGNHDGDTVHKNEFEVPIIAQYIRVNPMRWRDKISMRVEVYGCDYVADTLYFNGSSLVKVDLLRDPISASRETVRFRFKTSAASGALLYARGTQGDHLALQLRDNRLLLNLDLGSGTPTSMSVGSLLDDNIWHDVVISRNRRDVLFSVDRVVVQDRIKGEFSRLNLNRALYIGGVPNIQEGLVVNLNFTGCIENMYLNATNVIQELKQGYDSGEPFKYQKVNTLYSCPEPVIVPVTFLKEGSYAKLRGYSGGNTLNVSLEFRTYENHGLLVYHKFKTDGHVKVFLEDGKVKVELDSPGSPLVKLDNFAERYNDGRWHALMLTMGTDALQLALAGRAVRTARRLRFLSGAAYYIAGGKAPPRGFVGCMRRIAVDGNYRLPTDWKKDEYCCPNEVVFDACQMIDRCSPSPCEHGGQCEQGADEFSCDCRGTGYAGAVCHTSIHPLSCQAHKNVAAVQSSADIHIDVDGSGPLPAFPVTCHFLSDGRVVTGVRHTAESGVVDGHQEAGSFRQDVEYDADRAQLEALLNRSASCSQRLHYACRRSRLLNSPSDEGSFQPFAWWVSRGGQRMDHWAGAPPGSRMCRCGVAGGCVDPTKWCNCDAERAPHGEQATLYTLHSVSRGGQRMDHWAGAPPGSRMCRCGVAGGCVDPTKWCNCDAERAPHGEQATLYTLHSVSRGGQRMDHWAGAPPGSRMCRCGVAGGCVDPTKWCNCDAERAPHGEQATLYTLHSVSRGGQRMDHWAGAPPGSRMCRCGVAGGCVDPTKWCNCDAERAPHGEQATLYTLHSVSRGGQRMDHWAGAPPGSRMCRCGVAGGCVDPTKWCNCDAERAPHGEQATLYTLHSVSRGGQRMDHWAGAPPGSRMCRCGVAGGCVDPTKWCNCDAERAPHGEQATLYTLHSVSRGGQRMDHWAGAPPGSRMCRCGVAGGCVDPTKWCNCDAERAPHEFQGDGGDITEKEYLPVKQLRFGDTGSHLDEKEGRYTLGPLLCEGDDLFNDAVTFRVADAIISLPTFDFGHSGDIYLEFKTTQENSVLLHSKGPQDYIMLSLIGGDQLQFQFQVGDTPLGVSVETSTRLADNRWHSVSIERNRKEARLVVDGALKNEIRTPVEPARALHLSTALVLGAALGRSKGYVGCVRALLLGGRRVHLAHHARGQYGVSVGCVGKCASSPCLNNGTCLEGYDGYSCDCRWTAFKGPICADEIGVNLRPNSMVKYDFLGSWRSTINERLRVGFTTTNPKGFLLGLYSNLSSEYLTLMVSNSGHLRVVFDFGFERQEIVFQGKHFALGQYHDVRLSRKDGGATMLLQVDNYETQEYKFNIKQSADAQFNNIQYMYIGRNETMSEGFVGCVSRVEFDDIFPLKLLFQQDPPPNVRSLGVSALHEDFCGVEPVTHPPEAAETRPPPALGPPRDAHHGTDEAILASMYRRLTIATHTLSLITRPARVEVGGLLFHYPSFPVLNVVIRTGRGRCAFHSQFWTPFPRTKMYEFRTPHETEERGAEGASDPDAAALAAATGPRVTKRREFFI
ncbi:hypothetical protein ACJJTC_014720 [Scirpophaga incertulas]